MNLTILQMTLYFLIPFLSGLIGYVIKSTVQRIERLEDITSDSIDEEAVRLIISDKIDPIQEDIKEIKEDVKSLYFVNIKNNSLIEK